jgi:predicted HTH domain antitoxin
MNNGLITNSPKGLQRRTIVGMTLKIPDDLLKADKLDERGILLELACGLFDAQRLSLGQAARLAGLNRTQFEDELHDRKIPIYHYSDDEFQQDMRALTKMSQQGQ